MEVSSRYFDDKDLILLYNSNIFQSDTFNTFLSRVLRYDLFLLLGLDRQNEIVKQEESLVQKSRDSIIAYLSKRQPIQGLSTYKTKTVITSFLKRRYLELLEFQDIDEDLKSSLANSTSERDFGDIFPDSWMDS
jgi:hypothetical protein